MFFVWVAIHRQMEHAHYLFSQPMSDSLRDSLPFSSAPSARWGLWVPDDQSLALLGKNRAVRGGLLVDTRLRDTTHAWVT